MKNAMKFLVLAVIVLGFAGSSFGQSSATVTGVGSSAYINIPIQLALTGGTSLAFGNIVPGTSAGTVEIDVAALRTAGGGTTLAPTTVGTVGVPEFTVTGEGAHAFTITLPGNGTVSLTKSGAPAMALSGFNHNSDLVIGGSAGASGTDVFKVGAILAVGASQPGGSYTGLFNVTVNYN